MELLGCQQQQQQQKKIKAINYRKKEVGYGLAIFQS